MPGGADLSTHANINDIKPDVINQSNPIDASI